MARTFDNNTANYLSASPPVTAEPFSVAFLVKSNTTGVTELVMTLGQNGVANQRHAAYITTDNKWRVTTSAGGTEAFAATGAIIASGVWFWAIAIYAAQNSRRAVHIAADGTITSASDATSRTLTGIDAFFVGSNTVQTNAWNGLISHGALWNIALSDDDLAMFAAGYGPQNVRPDALVSRWEMGGWGSPEPDLVGGFPLTVNGTLAAADQPRIIYGPRSRLIVPAQTPPPAPVAVPHYTGFIHDLGRLMR